MKSREVFKLFYYQERGTVISYNNMRVSSVFQFVFLLVVSSVGPLIFSHCKRFCWNSLHYVA